MLEFASECLIMMDEHINFAKEVEDEDEDEEKGKDDDDHHHFISIQFNPSIYLPSCLTALATRYFELFPLNSILD